MNRRLSIRTLRTLIVIAGSLLMLSERSSASPWAEPCSPAARAEAPYTAARYRIDPGSSRFIVRAFAGGLFSALAHDHTIAIREFTGETEFTYGTVEPASFQMTIKAASLEVTDKVKPKDRQDIETTMRNEVLEISKYPEINFRSSSVSASKTGEGQYQTRIAGEVTLHGVSRPLTINARLEFGDSSLRAQGGFSLKQSSFGIKQVSVAGGTVKVKDELKFTFDIVAHP